jgi:hypothetical protein
VVINMPRKTKPRKPVTPPDEVWVAPRPVNQSEPRTFEPAGIGRSNRYLEFADIALGVKNTSFKKKKASGSWDHVQHDQQPDGHDQHAGGKVTSISRAKALKHRASPQGFGAFRGSR